jgi:anti-sigma factor RsiW
MNCDRARTLLDSSTLLALGPGEDAQLQIHLEGCDGCTDASRRRPPTSELIDDASLYFRAPAALRERITEDIRRSQAREREQAPRRRPRFLFSWPLSFASGAALTALLAILVFQIGHDGGDALQRELVSSHVRSLMADHLTDVPSSDKHTVKPWFDGRLDFAPPVPDFEPQGFSLVGGRLDYISGRSAAALVYKRRQHLINLFVFDGESAESEGTLELHGYNLVHWNLNGMSFWAVSDLNPEELHQFAKLCQN